VSEEEFVRQLEELDADYDVEMMVADLFRDERVVVA